MRIGLAQTRQTSNKQDNRAAILAAIEEGADQGAQILCFPETQTIGYRVDIATPDAPVDSDWLGETHAEIAHRCGERGMACVLGTELPCAASKPTNSALIIDERGSIIGAHHKTILTPLDAVAYSAGTQQHTFELVGVTVGVVICYEAFRFAHTTAECVRRGAQLIFHPQNNTTRPNDWKIPIHHAMIVTRAAENTVWFASCNACLPQQNSCMIVAPDGRIQAQTQLQREQVIVEEIDIDLATRAMFRIAEGEQDTAVDDSGAMLFADTVDRSEWT